MPAGAGRIACPQGSPEGETSGSERGNIYVPAGAGRIACPQGSPEGETTATPGGVKEACPQGSPAGGTVGNTVRQPGASEATFTCQRALAG